MAPRKSDGPEERGDAPAGPEKLSAVDGASITLKAVDRQASARARQPDCATVVLIVAPDPERRGYFFARLAADDRLLARSRTPFFDAARTLIAAGFDPATRLTMMHAGCATESLSATVGPAVQFTVEESAHGPVLRRFRMASRGAVEASRTRLSERG
jgi:hypothetical protein